MTASIITLPGSEYLDKLIVNHTSFENLDVTINAFPDEETYLRVNRPVNSQVVFIVGSLDRPNTKILPLVFLASKLREQGVRKLVLVSPYLPYMRQDKEFIHGECITSKYFAQLISNYFDHLITIDPHLHRYHSLNDIYSIPSSCPQASNLISNWIKDSVYKPIVIGPDSESKQWVKQIAAYTGIPYLIYKKRRLADDQVEIETENLDLYQDCTPVIVDDIISTAGTMATTIQQISFQRAIKPICLAIHAVFAENALTRLKDSDPSDIITTNSIAHETNRIDISSILIRAMLDYLQSSTTNNLQSHN